MRPEFPLPCAVSGLATARPARVAAIIKDFIALFPPEKPAPASHSCRGGFQSRVLFALSFARFHACLEVGIRRLVLGFLLFLPILVIRVGELALHLLLLLLPGFVLSLLRLSPLFIGAAVSTRAQDCERSIGITTSLLDDEVAVGI